MMKAMVCLQRGGPLVLQQPPMPAPGPHEIRVRITACGVCRTDLHVIDGELSNPKYPIVPGHEIVGRIDAVGTEVGSMAIGMRVGVPWLANTCHRCEYCKSGAENLCDAAEFTGYTNNGGYATHTIAKASYAIPLGEDRSDASLAPLLCAGLIGWRAFTKAGAGLNVGLYGFGAAAHIVAQIARWNRRRVFAFTRLGDMASQDYARALGCTWAGDSSQTPPEQLDSAIIFAPAGEMVPIALRAVKKGGRVVCAGIHMSDIPSFPYANLWSERHILSVANLTRQDGVDFFRAFTAMNIETTVTTYPLERANEAIDDLRHGRFQGAAVLLPAEESAATARARY